MQTFNPHPARSVDDYLAGLPEATRITLERLRQAIREAAPMAEEVISYQIPTYKYKGPLVHFAVQKNHCSLTVVSPTIAEMFGAELSSFKGSGRTIHFTPEKPLPAALVKKIVKQRIIENEKLEADKRAKEKK